MPQAPLPIDGTPNGWGAQVRSAIWGNSDAIDALIPRVSALEAATPGAPASIPGGVILDSFAGANDDAKLTAALSYLGAQTYAPHLFFSNRRYDFTTANRAVFSGLKLSGLGGHGNQQRSGNPIPNDIRFNGTGTWWVCPATEIFDVYMGGLCFQGNQNAQFMSCNPGVLWTSVFRDLGFNLWKNVLGNRTTRFLVTGVLFDGWWNTNNCYDTAYNLAGSDCNLWMGHHLLDTPQGISTTGANWVAGAYLLSLDFLEKSTIGPLFITGDQVSCVYITGNQDNAALVLNGQGRAEGRNKDTPCFGSNIRINGGGVTIRDWEIFYGATQLNTRGHTGEGGVITVTGSTTRALFDGIWYDRATGVPETTPFIYQTGGYVRINNIMTGAKGGAWTGKPRFRSIGGTYDIDNSVTLVTV